MKFGVLADSFEGAGAKYLTEVEVDSLKSNQHEFQGINSFWRVLGRASEKIRFPATYYWLDDEEGSEPIRVEAFGTWGNVRKKPSERIEYRLYYSVKADRVVHKARAGDLLVIAKTKEGALLVIICPAKSTIARQLLWLFGLDPCQERRCVKELDADNSVRLGFAAHAILDDLGIVPEEPEPDALDALIGAFGLNFPPTAEFSQFARETFQGANPVAEPDDALISWMDHEEVLFRHLERHVVADRLSQGFMAGDEADVDGFISFSLSVQNRRKSRAGWALGHHVEAILGANYLRYKREATTEKRNGPDFLFPSQVAYHNPTLDTSLLTMLAAKTSCKDRWRQVLAEADRIREKHLLTLQPGISSTQTAEMQSAHLQLVVPRGIFSSYQPDQQNWLMDVAQFLDIVKTKQGVFER